MPPTTEVDCEYGDYDCTIKSLQESFNTNHLYSFANDSNCHDQTEFNKLAEHFFSTLTGLEEGKRICRSDLYWAGLILFTTVFIPALIIICVCANRIVNREMDKRAMMGNIVLVRRRPAVHLDGSRRKDRQQHRDPELPRTSTSSRKKGRNR